MRQPSGFQPEPLMPAQVRQMTPHGQRQYPS
jgi:hypothetical protein